VAEFEFFDESVMQARVVTTCIREIEELLGSLKERGPSPADIDEALRQIMARRGVK
jgi:hypothetical protein